jgi:ATP adenylyltransferase
MIVARGERVFIIMNRYPYTSGHVMVVPFAHEPTYENLDTETRAELIEWINKITRVIRDLYNPQGFNVGANIGSAAGAGIAEHVHFHVVPRWGGDTNFMSTLADVRVLPEDLPETYRRLVYGWQNR